MPPRSIFTIKYLVILVFLTCGISQAAADELSSITHPARFPQPTAIIRVSDKGNFRNVNEQLPPLPEPPAPVTHVPNIKSVQVIMPDPNNSKPAFSLPAPVPTSDILYWIVSSRHLPHDITGCPKVPSFCLMKRLACGQLVPGTMNELQSWLTPGDPIFLMAHGSFVDWQLSVKDAHGTYCWVNRFACGRPVKMIFWSWPSDGPYSHVPTIDVVHSGKRAAYDGIYLSYLIDFFPMSSPVCITGHSHGTRVIASALHFRAGGEIMECYRGAVAPHRRIRVVFTAAAFDHQWLNPGNRYGCALTRVECFVNLINRHDAALVVYPLVVPFSGRSIARSGFTRRDSMLQGSLAYRTVEYDVTQEIGFKHTWPNYYQNDELGCLLAPYILNWGAVNYQVQEPTFKLKEPSLTLKN